MRATKIKRLTMRDLKEINDYVLVLPPKFQGETVYPVVEINALDSTKIRFYKQVKSYEGGDQFG